MIISIIFQKSSASLSLFFYYHSYYHHKINHHHHRVSRGQAKVFVLTSPAPICCKYHSLLTHHAFICPYLFLNFKPYCYLCFNQWNGRDSVRFLKHKDIDLKSYFQYVSHVFSCTVNFTSVLLNKERLAISSFLQNCKIWRNSEYTDKASALPYYIN